MLAQPPLPEHIRPLWDSELVRLRAKHSNLPTVGNCLTCHGTKTYRWYSPEGEVTDFSCDCEAQWLLHLWLLSSGIERNHQRLFWRDMTATEDMALGAVAQYAMYAPQFVDQGRGLMLYGGHGSGKTSLAVLLLKTLIADGHDGYFTTFTEMLDTYTGGWRSPNDKAWFDSRVKNAGVLVIDDVGREFQGRTSSGLPERAFEEVLRHRLSAGIPTFVTTNKAPEEINQGYGGGVMSLLAERSTTYLFQAADFRRADSVKVRFAEEVRLGLTRPIALDRVAI